ncbi:MAG: HAD family phosphatase [bacterium]|nr:HAD family phosphatase [bacterium]
MRQSPSAILFDCSGVIIDSNFHQFISWKRLFEEEGVPFTMVDFQTKVSGGTREMGIRKMMGNISEERVQEMAQRKQKIFDQFIALDAPRPFSGIVELLSTLQRRGVALATVSASRNARILLTRADLLSYFHTIVTPPVKPLIFSDEELYMRAMRELGKGPKECVVVEDSPVSIATAKKIGAFTIGIAIIAVPDALQQADRVVANHKELRDVLLEMFPTHK